MTTPDPQLCPVKLLRPFEGFNTVYTGAASTRPIMFSEVMPSAVVRWGTPLDQETATVNSPRLLAGVKVPLLARVLLWLPKFTWNSGADGYRWVIQWRWRSMFAFKRKPGTGWHFPLDAVGAGNLDVIPACDESIPYIQTEPAGALDRSVTNLRTEDIHGGASDLGAPFTPDGGSGIVQQGIASNELPLWQWHETASKGDEVLIGLYRPASGGVWNFGVGGVDSALLTALNSDANIGIHLTYGIAP